MSTIPQNILNNKNFIEFNVRVFFKKKNIVVTPSFIDYNNTTINNYLRIKTPFCSQNTLKIIET